MINLLPPDIKQNYTYARRNQYLRKWIIGVLSSIAGVAIIITGGLFFINNSIHSYQTQNASATDQLKARNMEKTQAQVETISSNLKLVVQVLSKEILFSKLLTQIGSAMPPGAVLAGLTIGKVDGALDLQANATSYDTATQVQVNLADPKNQIFSKADIVQITCNDPKTGSQTDTTTIQSAYPCNVTIRALFNKNNQFLFINNSTPTTGAAK